MLICPHAAFFVHVGQVVPWAQGDQRLYGGVERVPDGVRAVHQRRAAQHRGSGGRHAMHVRCLRCVSFGAVLVIRVWESEGHAVRVGRA